jgi:hypothetical protein
MGNIIIMAEIKPVLTKVFEVTDPSILHAWFAECTKRGFNNNISVEAMRFDWVLEQGGRWWASMENGKIIAISGTHPHFLDGWRIMFRGAQLTSRKNIEWSPSFSHIHMWYDHALHQIDYVESNGGKDIPCYCSSDSQSSSDSSTSARYYKNFKLAAEIGIIENLGHKKIYNELQNVWRIHKATLKEKYVVRPGLYSLMDVINDKNVREHVSS